ncbi:hypothetical protein J7E50_10740 [Pedobacter sp. ISL-68]|uniref:hypothetical protein n=1 Tax=unclassified Pedobacter TaxID=2628915 RepID=UPI001BE8BD96|nr:MULTISPECIES: hypothetical protein [unclassified Pedobacter]MBT2561308.1 hypothetical protein [Pedobacter sp. ISL-64]MBT2590697.1 hypothetical protein [Pedobacter sp. ISL-68]
MKFNCFILHSDPAFLKIASLIDRHPRLKLMPVEKNINAISCRTFPTEFSPDITFIEYHTFRNHYDRLFTLIKKSSMVVLLRHEQQTLIEQLEDVDFSIPFVTNNKGFCKWISLFITTFESSIYHIPKFTKRVERVAGLKKNALINISVEDIVTVANHGGICYIGLLDRTILSSHTFAELFMLYRDDNYIQISEEVVVNMRHCDGFCMDIVRMANGEDYQVGKRFRLSFWEDYIRPGFIDSQAEILKWNKFFRSTDERYTSGIRNECLEDNRIFLSN